jgi:hypothetical protein
MAILCESRYSCAFWPNLSLAYYVFDFTVKIGLTLESSDGKLPIFLFSNIYYYVFSSFGALVDDNPAPCAD